jgi:hypothetical protein
LSEKLSVSLTLNGEQHDALRHRLFPGDGLEAAALILCGRRIGNRRERLLAREVHPVPLDHYSVRTPLNAVWSTDFLVPLLEKAERTGDVLVKVHSHPSGFDRFSAIDDSSDKRLLQALLDWFDDDRTHGSAVMLPDGRMFGRVIDSDGVLHQFAHINIIGDDLLFWRDAGSSDGSHPQFAASHCQAFGEGTYQKLRGLSVAVIGCSGTGSPVIEQLARLGVGELVIVDDDVVEERNLNRILNATVADAQASREKVEVLAEAVEKMGTGTKVIPIAESLWSPGVVHAVGECDLVFGCMDTIDGRFLLNTLATYYQLAYFDLGVRIAVVPEGPRIGEVIEICGSVHYLKPGGSSLMSRGLFSLEDVRAAGLARTDPLAHSRNLADGYIKGVTVRRPAVISLNMLIASIGVNEMLARLHPFRDEPNRAYEHVEISLGEMTIFPEPKPEKCPLLRGDLAKGDVWPPLGMPELSF